MNSLAGISNGGGEGEAVADAPVEVVVVKDIFDIKISLPDPKNKIKVIKEVRAITGLGLKEVRLVFRLKHHD
jgi:large subunit ribosomal protein L7/L12